MRGGPLAHGRHGLANWSMARETAIRQRGRPAAPSTPAITPTLTLTLTPARARARAVTGQTTRLAGALRRLVLLVDAREALLERVLGRGVQHLRLDRGVVVRPASPVARQWAAATQTLTLNANANPNPNPNPNLNPNPNNPNPNPNPNPNCAPGDEDELVGGGARRRRDLDVEDRVAAFVVRQLGGEVREGGALLALVR